MQHSSLIDDVAPVVGASQMEYRMSGPWILSSNASFAAVDPNVKDQYMGICAITRIGASYLLLRFRSLGHESEVVVFPPSHSQRLGASSCPVRFFVFDLTQTSFDMVQLR